MGIAALLLTVSLVLALGALTFSRTDSGKAAKRLTAAAITMALAGALVGTLTVATKPGCAQQSESGCATVWESWPWGTPERKPVKQHDKAHCPGGYRGGICFY